MTTSVDVRARAWGARVEVEGQEPVELGPHEDRSFHIPEGESLTLTIRHGEKPVEEATEEPEVSSTTSDTAPPAQPPAGDGTGTDETAVTTDRPARGRSGSDR